MVKLSMHYQSLTYLWILSSASNMIKFLLVVEIRQAINFHTCALILDMIVVELTFYFYEFMIIFIISFRRVTRGGRRGRSPPAFFQKLEKSALILGKTALIVVIYRLNFSFKMQFLRVSRNKSGDFSLRGKISFSCCTWLFLLYMNIKVP